MDLAYRFAKMKSSDERFGLVTGQHFLLKLW